MKHGGNVWEGNSPAQWLDFSANLRPEGTPAWVMDAMQMALQNVCYYPDLSMERARKGLATYAGVPEAYILPTAGGAAAIDLVLQRLQGTVYTEQFTFCEYAQRAAVHGRTHRVWHGACSSGDTVFVANPNNPTGASMTTDEVLTLHQAVCARGGELIVDEAFIDFCPECSVRRNVQPGLTIVGSMTKTLCIPGVRLGYVCAAPERIAQIERRALPWAVSALASSVAAKLPEHLDEIKADAAINAARREKMATSLRTLGARVLPSSANFLLADFGCDMTEAAARLKEKGILVRTCASFGLPPNMWRLAVKTEEENARLLACIEEDIHAR